MDFYETLKSGALCGKGGGEVDNLLTSIIEQGAIDILSGENVDNTIRLRTKDATELSAGDYTLFFTAAGTMYARGVRYAADGSFIEAITGVGSAWLTAPVAFHAEAGQKFRFTFTIDPYSTADMQPSDLHNLIIVKD